MANIGTSFDTYPSSTSVAPTLTSAPTSTVGGGGPEKRTQEEILKKLQRFRSYPHVSEAIIRIGDLQLDGINAHDKAQMETMFGFMHGISDTDIQAPYELQAYMGRVEGLYRNYVVDTKKVTADAKKAAEEIIPARLTGDATWDLFSDIESEFLATHDMDSQSILELARAIQIDSPDIGKDDWDSFFDSLYWRVDSGGIFTPGERTELKDFITRFKKESPLYKNGLDIEGIDDYLDGVIEKVEEASESDAVSIQLPGYIKPILFDTKKGALQFIYKMKLVLSKLDKADLSFMALFGSFLELEGNIWGGVLGITTSGYNYWWPIGVLTTLAGAATAGAVVAGHVYAGIVLYGPIESLKRNIVDFFAINFGKNSPKTGILMTDVPPEKRKWLAFRYKLYQFMKHAHDMHHDQLPENTRVTVFDGFTDTGDKQEDIRTKQKTIRYLEQKYQNDPDRLALLNRLKEPQYMGLVGGKQTSATRSFWLRVRAIDDGKGWLGRVGQVFDPSDQKSPMINRMNEALKKGRESLKVIFKNMPDKIPEGGFDIETLKKTDFFLHIEALIDLDGTLSNTEEIKRNKLIEEYVKKIQNLEILSNPEEIKQEFMRVAKGKMPKFLIEERVNSNLTSASGKRETDLSSFLKEVQEGNWIGTEAEFDNVMQEIRQGSYSFSSQKVKYTDVEIEKYLKEGKKLLDLKYTPPKDLDAFRGSFKVEKEFAIMLDNSIDMSNIDNELESLFEDLHDSVGKPSNDYTKGHLHMVIYRIMQGEEYSQAQRPFSNTTDFDNVNSPVGFGKRTKIPQKLRTDLFLNLDNELSSIEAIPNTEKSRKMAEFEIFKKKYKNAFEPSTEAEHILKSGNSTYESLKTRHGKLKHELKGYLSDFAVVENGKFVSKKVQDVFDNAEKIAVGEAKVVVARLQQRASEPDTRVPIAQFRNALRAAIAGDLSEAEVTTIDFDDYDDESRLSAKAQSVLLEEIKEESIFDIDNSGRNMHRVSHTPEARFPSIVQKWNNFGELMYNGNALLRIVRQQEQIQQEIGDINIRIQQAEVSGGPVTSLISERSERNRLFTSLEEKKSDIRVASDLKVKDARDLKYELDKKEVAFRKVLVANPGFQEYAIEKSIIPNDHTAETLWKGFLEHAENNSVKAGKTKSFTIDPAVKPAANPIDTTSSAPRTLYDEADELVDRVFHFQEISGNSMEGTSQRQLFGVLSQAIDDGKATDIKDLEKMLTGYEIKSNEEIAEYIRIKSGISGDIAGDLKRAAKAGTPSLRDFVRKNFTIDKFGKIST